MRSCYERKVRKEKTKRKTSPQRQRCQEEINIVAPKRGNNARSSTPVQAPNTLLHAVKQMVNTNKSNFVYGILAYWEMNPVDEL